MDENAYRFLAAKRGIDVSDPRWKSIFLSHLEIEFERTRNPVLPWGALKWAVDEGLSVPDWVLRHFNEAGAAINKIVRDGRGAEAERIGRALGFGASAKGSAPATKSALQEQRDFEIAVHVYAEHAADQENGGGKLEAVVQKVAQEFGVSRASVFKAFQKHKESAKQTVDAFVATYPGK